MNQVLKVLLIDDSEDDGLLIVRHLERSGINPVTRRVETVDALRTALDAFQWDLILCDVAMPNLNALGALREVKSRGFDIPFIIVSGSVPEEQLVALMKAGAHDIIVKDRLPRLVAAIEREMQDADVRRQRRHAESQLLVAIESISEGFILFDAQDRLVICNETYKRIYDATADLTVPGATFEDMIRVGAERGQCEQAIGRADQFIIERTAQHRACGEPFEQMLTDGRCILIDERRTRDGGTVGIHSDITALKTAERNLRENEEFLLLIADNLPILVAYFDCDGRYRFVNRTGSEWYARGPDAVIGRKVEDVIGAAAFEPFRRNHEDARRGVAQSYDSTATFPDGVTRDVHVAYAPDRGPDGEVRGFVAMVADITERVRLEMELRHAQKMESLGTLSGGIAHEFNNMLLPIAGLLELSLGEIDDRDEIHENLTKALENARRGAALVDKILTFSRIDQCTPAQTNIAAAVDDAVALLRATIPATVHISKRLDDIGDACVDKLQISQIVMNLGVNAMHAIGEQVGRIEFELTAEAVKHARPTTSGQLLPGHYARLSVTDTGCGMDERTIARIFEPFFTTKAIGKGTGMGLAFVHGAIRNHGGAIDVKSRPGEGTAFDVFVPFEPELSSALLSSDAA
jgi:two-component system, cell cycle sensor histidine kinase and response regulator CckA